jgi:hypothetical protein
MVMNSEQTLTQEQIDVLEEHLPYELDALEETLSAWGNSGSKAPPATRLEWFARIAPIEALWVHARLLQEFFTKTEQRAAYANHFTRNANSYEIPDVEKIQQQIVHLNYGRPRGLDPEKLDYWFADRFVRCVDRAVLKFQADLIDDAKRYWRMRESIVINTPSMTPQPTNAIWAISSNHPNRGPEGPTTDYVYSGLAPTLPSPTRRDQ